MTDSDPVYAAFLGTWVLDIDSCDYEQGDPPTASTYYIADDGGRLVFTMTWTDTGGAHHKADFSGVPDGQMVPFDGAGLADAISIRAVSPRELNSSAYFEGDERMVAQRQLDDTGMAMRIVQMVRFSDGSRISNVGVYRKQLTN